MKRITLIVVTLLLVGCFADFSQAAPLSPIEQAQLTQYLKSKVTGIWLIFNQIVNVDGEERNKYSFENIPVSTGKKTLELEVGDYRLYAHAGKDINSRDTFVSDSFPVVTVTEDKKSSVKIKFRLNDYFLSPVTIENPRGTYTEGGLYEVKILDNGSDRMQFSENDKALFHDGKLIFHVWTYQPYDNESTLHLSVTDRHGIANDMVFNFNIMDIVSDDYKSMCLEPKTGEVEIEVGFVNDAKVVVELSPTSPPAQLLTFGLSMVPTAEFNFAGLDSSYLISKMTIRFPQALVECSSGGVALFPSLNSSEAVGRSVIIGDWKINRASATFAGINFRIPQNGEQKLIAALNLNTWESSCLQTGIAVQTVLTDFEAVNENTAEVVKWSGLVAGNPMYVYKSTPIITSLPLPGWEPLLGGRIVDVNKIKIAGSMFGFIDWAEITYTVEKSSDLNIVNAIVYDTATYQEVEGAITIIDLGPGSNAGSITFIPANPQIVNSDGTTYILQLEIDGNIADGSYITTWIDQPSSYDYNGTYEYFTTTNTSFIWSDRSTVDHSKITLDWSNSSLVPGLPTVKQTITR